jgi:thiol-disulfide isomerase/thioredoxin
MKKLTIYIVLAMLCLKLTASAQDKPTVTALKIGDIVPDITINNIINYPAKTAKISDFKGKLLILDFWDTWCSSCIKFLPQANTLNRTFLDRAYILPVTGQKLENIQKFLLGSAFLKSYKITSVVNDQVLTKQFPHNQLPHEVWIDPQGKLIAVTTDEYVTAQNIEQVLKGQKPQWDFKNDKLDYNADKPLFFSDNNVKLKPGSFLYSTAFTGYLEGVPPAQQVKTDTQTQTKRFSFINQPVLNLYALILNSGLPFMATRRILPTDHSNVYVYDVQSGYYDEWLKTHTYTYETIVPVGFSESEVLKQLQLQIEYLLKIKGSVQEREIDCWILKRKDSQATLQTAYAKKDIQLNPSRRLFTHHIQAADLEWLLNQKENATPVINESATTAPFDLDFKTLPVTIDEWNVVLKPLGFEFIKQTRKLDMFVLTEQRHLISSPSLEPITR